MSWRIAQEAASGVAAGLLSSTITYPLDLVKTRLQADPGAADSTVAILRAIVQRDGVAGLFVGLHSEYVKVGDPGHP